jgi:hypothetical protein
VCVCVCACACARERERARVCVHGVDPSHDQNCALIRNNAVFFVCMLCHFLFFLFFEIFPLVRGVGVSL